MTRLRRQRLALVFAGGAAIFGVVGIAEGLSDTQAPNPPETATLGVPTTIRVVLKSPTDGKPVANTPLIFHTDATFANVTDEVELGQASTNAEGVAVLTFEPHVAGNHEVRVDFEDVGRKVNLAKVMVSVTGSSQLVRSTAGIKIPGLNVWLLIALIASIWSILLSVSFRVIAIARGGGLTGADGSAARGSASRDNPGPLEADR